jgi:hypothetical protein
MAMPVAMGNPSTSRYLADFWTVNFRASFDETWKRDNTGKMVEERPEGISQRRCGPVPADRVLVLNDAEDDDVHLAVCSGDQGQDSERQGLYHFLFPEYQVNLEPGLYETLHAHDQRHYHVEDGAGKVGPDHRDNPVTQQEHRGPEDQCYDASYNRQDSDIFHLLVSLEDIFYIVSEADEDVVSAGDVENFSRIGGQAHYPGRQRDKPHARDGKQAFKDQHVAQVLGGDGFVPRYFPDHELVQAERCEDRQYCSDGPRGSQFPVVVASEKPRDKDDKHKPDTHAYYLR